MEDPENTSTEDEVVEPVKEVETVKEEKKEKRKKKKKEKTVEEKKEDSTEKYEPLPDTPNEPFQLDLYGGQLMIHNVIRRNLNQIILVLENLLQAQDQINPSDIKGFALSAYSALNLLDGHHHTEEEHFFPLMQKRLGLDISKLVGEHEEMLKMMGEVIEIFQQMQKDPTKSYDFAGLLKSMKELRRYVGPHLDMEEQMFNRDAIAKEFQKDNKKQSKATVKAGKSHVKNASLEFPLMLYSLTESERKVLLKELPWILSSILIPRVWVKKARKLQMLKYVCYPPKEGAKW